MLVTCSSLVVAKTLAHLRDAGRANRECVVLWLGRRVAGTITVMDAYLPAQFAKSDVFRIPPAGMNALYAELRRQRLMVAAQVHSHPRKAFHSKADDDWAIVRHENALSIVVPYFASTTTETNFLTQSKVYRFSSAARWVEVKGPLDTWIRLS